MNDGERPQTFLARAEKLKAKGLNGNGAGLTLAIASQMWPTPAARDWRSGEASQETYDKNARPLNEVATLWSTPRSSDGEKGGPNQSFGAGGVPLPSQAAMWMTPRSHEVGDYQYSRGDHSKPVPTLTGQASMWSTPSIADTQGSRKSRSGDRSDELLMSGQAANLASLLPDRPISTVGEESSHIRRTLNPLFVEWLMMWPFGWTSLALMPPASIGCGCSATELSRFKLHMRFALSQFGSPGDIPVQQSLFG